MSCDESDNNEHDQFRFTIFKRGEICDRKYSENGILWAFLRLFNRSVVTCQCPTYKFNNEFLEIGMCYVSWSVSHRGHSRFNIFTISGKWNISFFDTYFPNMFHPFDCTRSIYKWTMLFFSLLYLLPDVHLKIRRKNIIT